MAKILVVEDTPDLILYEARLLERAGHRVIRCNGAPSLLSACPMLRFGSCPLPESVDMIVFDCGFAGPMRHRSYNGSHLLRAYRSHPWYGRLPMLLVAPRIPQGIGGTGPIELVGKFSEPRAVVEAVERLTRTMAATA
jgi:CheY-like chemotaxis protein